MRSQIQESSGFPGCVRFLDGMDIVLQHSLSYYGKTYFNHKKRYALNIQGICDANRRFAFISGSFLSSVSDATVFGETSLFKLPNLFFSSPDEYVLADKAYRVTRHCMTPYKEPLASREAGGYCEFNLHLAEAQIKIEHAFVVLKNRWGSLKGISVYGRRVKDHVRVVAWILSCIVLHNFLCDFEHDEEWVASLGRQEAEEGFEEYEVIGEEAERQAGSERRHQMREYFFNQ